MGFGPTTSILPQNKFPLETATASDFLPGLCVLARFLVTWFFAWQLHQLLLKLL